MNNIQPSGKRWYVLGLGAAINASAFAMSMSCMPVLFSEIAAELNLDVVQIGVVWGFGSVAAIFSIPSAGFLADRFGARRVLAIACLLAGIFGALRGMSDSYLSLTITSILFGMVGEAVPVIVVKNASLWFYGKGLGMAQGVITAAVAGAMMIGSMISATVLSPWLGGWQYVTFFYGGMTFLLGLLWLQTAPEHAGAQTAASYQSPFAAFKHVLKRSNIWLVGIAMLGYAGSNKGVMGYLPLYLRKIGWAGAAADGALASLNAAGMVAAVPFTLISDRLGLRKSVVIPGAIISGIGVFLLWRVTEAGVWPLAILSGLFRDMIWAVAATMAVETDGIGPEYAGIAVGVVHSFTRLGYAFTPPIGNSLALIQPGLPFVFWAGLNLLAFIAFSLTDETGRMKRRENTGLVK